MLFQPCTWFIYFVHPLNSVILRYRDCFTFQGYYLGVLTPDDFRYNYVWQTTTYKNNHFRFWVRACHDVHLNLSPVHGERFYEVVIGGWDNSMSVIRFGGSHRVEYRENGIVDCKEFREFWVSWDRGVIRVGKGNEIRRQEFMFWSVEDFGEINHLSMSAGYGSDALWVFNNDLGKNILAETI